MSASSSSVGSRLSGTSSGTASSKPVATTTSSTLTPGCTERRRIERSGVSKSNTPRFETTTLISWKAPRGTRSYPTPETQSTFSTNTRGEWLGTQ